MTSSCCRAPQTLTAWVAEAAAQVQGRDAADMVLLFSALQIAAKQIAFAVSQVLVLMSQNRPGTMRC